LGWARLFPIRAVGSRKVGRDNGQQIDPNRAEIAANPR
jgi:hypothetical protein